MTFERIYGFSKFRIILRVNNLNGSKINDRIMDRLIVMSSNKVSVIMQGVGDVINLSSYDPVSFKNVF